jgi:cytochrome b561
MSNTGRPARYDRVAIVLHWLIAALVVTNIALGLYFTNSAAAEAGISVLPPLHKSIGLTVLLLSIARLAWRLGHPAPPPLPPFPLVARLVHWAFYILLIAVPLAGWALVSVSPRNIPTVYFGLFPWPHIAFLHAAPVAARRVEIARFVALHNSLAFLAAALIALHVVGALYHMLRRDGAMRRILF